MSKVVILGTDLHGNPTELASKTVLRVKKLFPKHKILSIEHRKPIQKTKDTLIIPKLIDNSRIRRTFQALILPFYLLALRFLGYNNLLTFWVANSKYHQFLFKFLNLIRFKTYFTIIASKPNFSSIKYCQVLISQSKEMFNEAKKHHENVKLIYPSISLDIFKPTKKEDLIVIPSVPYSVSDFSDRGIDFLLQFLDKHHAKAIMILRSQESYEFIKSKKIKNLTLINKDLSDKELSSILSKAKIMPLIYKESPDMPLSAMEGLASGCAIICKNNLSISNIIKEYKSGISIKQDNEFESAIKKILSNPSYNKNARKTAEEYFSQDNIKNYSNLIG